MRHIELDGTKWKSVHEFYDALLRALGSPELHGRNINALVDSMIWGGINRISPPYTVRIYGISSVPKDVRDHIQLARKTILEARSEFRRLRGSEIDVEFEVVE